MMGLDTTHDCWHGAYSAFSRWREHVAVVAGYEIAEYQDEHGYRWRNPALPWEMFEDEHYMGEGWDKLPNVEDPLLYLIVHSDCEGLIHPEQGRHLAARLEQILPNLDESKSGGHIWSMREVTLRFIDGLRRAAAANEDVVFH